MECFSGLILPFKQCYFPIPCLVPLGFPIEWHREIDYELCNGCRFDITRVNAKDMLNRVTCHLKERK